MTKPDVVILCGGLGTRFQEITAAVPKPMALIGNRPFLDIVLAKFAQAGFNRFILCVGHLAQVVKAHYQAYPQNIEIVFSEEQELLGTGGAVKHARLLIKSENFFVLNGDSYCETKLPAFLKFHLAKPDAVASIVLANKDERADTGGISLDESSQKITGYAEKNAKNLNYINTGIYLFSQKGFELMPPQKTFSLEYDFFPNLIGKGLYGFRTSGRVIDIGTPERYQQALDFFTNEAPRADARGIFNPPSLKASAGLSAWGIARNPPKPNEGLSSRAIRVPPSSQKLTLFGLRRRRITSEKKTMFNDQKVLVAGGTGMIGMQLVKLLQEKGAKVRIASLDKAERAPQGTEFMRLDLTKFDNCVRACQGMDYVFNLTAIKGSPAAVKAHPASFFVPMLLCNTNLAEAALVGAEVKWYLYTSTVGVYPPARVFREDDVWQGPPSENDKFAGWAKRMGELQLESYAIEYGLKNYSIIRPANVYGPYDNFNPKNSMVIPSLIKRALDGEDPFVVWGDGSAVRDFVHSRDVARAMIFLVENQISEPVNIGSGKGISIKDLVEIIMSNLPRKPRVSWDTTKPKGDAIRVMDVSRIMGYGFKNEVSFEEGIKEVMQWYRDNKANLEIGYNIFDEHAK